MTSHQSKTPIGAEHNERTALSNQNFDLPLVLDATAVLMSEHSLLPVVLTWSDVGRLVVSGEGEKLREILSMPLIPVIKDHSLRSLVKALHVHVRSIDRADGGNELLFRCVWQLVAKRSLLLPSQHDRLLAKSSVYQGWQWRKQALGNTLVARCRVSVENVVRFPAPRQSTTAVNLQITDPSLRQLLRPAIRQLGFRISNEAELQITDRGAGKQLRADLNAGLDQPNCINPAWASREILARLLMHTATPAQIPEHRPEQPSQSSPTIASEVSPAEFKSQTEANQPLLEQQQLNELESQVGRDGLNAVVAAFVEELATQKQAFQNQHEASSATEFDRAIHTLKGSSATMGAMALNSVAKNLEQQAKERVEISQEIGSDLLGTMDELLPLLEQTQVAYQQYLEQ